uniref:Uncharacterized protein n=1 Tax=Rhizophora mucronata TaxID=61149 RepID=A0A2P2PC35_RHIMU
MQGQFMSRIPCADVFSLKLKENTKASQEPVPSATLHYFFTSFT